MSCAQSISNVNNIFVFQVLVTLRYLGKGSYFSECGNLHGISKSSVCRAVEDVTTSIYKQLDNIKFSTRDEDIQNIKRFFLQLLPLPNVIGAIDGTLIPIIAPKDNEADFVCRKGFHAISVQAVADDSLRYEFLWFILDGSNSNVEERTFIFVICP
jgi:hypothetical protein